MRSAARLLVAAVVAVIAIVLLSLMPAAAAGAPADPRVEWLRANALRVRSVSPEDRDFSDLQPLKKVIGNAQIVLLGEPSHGDGTVFLAKTRLIRFLHEEMGFDVLAFESGFYECRKAWEALQAGGDPVAAARSGIFGIWSRSAEVQPLLAYLGERARTQHPLELAGFDNQFTADASANFLVADLREFLRQIGSRAPGDPGWPAFAAKVQSLTEATYDDGEEPIPSAEERKRFSVLLGKLREETAAAARTRRDWETAAWLRVLDNLDSFASMTWEQDAAVAATAAKRTRDARMAGNLIWMADERYRGRKIIVWAATFHAARHLSRIDTGRGPEMAELQEEYRTMATMGEVAYRALGPRMYTLGFTASEGKRGSWFQRIPGALAKPSDGSLEDLMQRAGLENAIVDFRHPPRGGGWLSQPIVSRPLGYTEMKADWTEVMDGMMFTRVMAPSTRAAQ